MTLVKTEGAPAVPYDYTSTIRSRTIFFEQKVHLQCHMTILLLLGAGPFSFLIEKIYLMLHSLDAYNVS